MNDPIKNNELMTTFSPKNVRKVNADIHFKKNNGDQFFFHMAFEAHEIIAAHLLKKDDWVYGIYLGNRKVGFLYPGELLTIEQQNKCFANYFPQDVNNLPEKIQIYEKDIEYHRCCNDAYCIIGEHNGKNIIQKTKKKTS